MGMSTGQGGDLNSEINVTPLVDVMLVLLIIFMVTAPMLQTGLELDLPQAEASLVPDEEGKLRLWIDKKGDVYLGEDPVPVKWEELEMKLAANAKVQSERELYIEADGTLPYQKVLNAMAIARKAGVAKLMMMTDPLETE